MNEQLRLNKTGMQRAAERLAAIHAKNDAIAATWPERDPSRQVRRRWARAKSPTRATPGRYAPRDLTDRSILKVWTEGAREFAFHATKGMRVRRAS